MVFRILFSPSENNCQNFGTVIDNDWFKIYKNSGKPTKDKLLMKTVRFFEPICFL